MLTMAGVGSALVEKSRLITVMLVLLKQQVLVLLAFKFSNKLWKSANNCGTSVI